MVPDYLFSIEKGNVAPCVLMILKGDGNLKICPVYAEGFISIFIAVK